MRERAIVRFCTACDPLLRENPLPGPCHPALALDPKSVTINVRDIERTVLTPGKHAQCNQFFQDGRAVREGIVRFVRAALTQKGLGTLRVSPQFEGDRGDFFRIA